MKKLLNGIPVTRYGAPSATCFVGVVLRLLEYIGDPSSEDEVFALSGAGLCFPWASGSSCDEVSVIPDIPERAFGAFGYESEYLAGDAVRDKAVCFERIKVSLDAGKPVIGFGITTKMPMACLIAGYDDGGLYTRSFWPPEGKAPDSDEYFYSPDWHENCSGLLFVGEKTGERLCGKAAYDLISDWALRFRCYKPAVTAEGKKIYVNQHAYNAMIGWLLDDELWEAPGSDGKEQFLKQAGLLLMGYYRGNLLEYLKKLDAGYPGVVNPAVLPALAKIRGALPGAQRSDLRLDEAVDPALADFAAMKDRALREKNAKYVEILRELDNSVQWTLFMPETVRRQQKGFKVDNFEYREYPAMRFVGFEGEEYADEGKRAAMMAKLDALAEFRSGFDYDLLFMHFYGLTVDHPWHGVWGRFMRADAPVPEGFISFDFLPFDTREPGAPYISTFAFATFSGDGDAMHTNEGFDGDAMYDVTRNIVLGDGVNIPYPEKYWTAEVFFDGCTKPGSGYLFSTGEWDDIPGKQKPKSFTDKTHQ